MAISCSERGLLLLRIRDEIRMTLAAYQTLYESSIAFGMRKALQAEHGKADMEAKVRPRAPPLTPPLTAPADCAAGAGQARAGGPGRPAQGQERCAGCAVACTSHGGADETEKREAERRVAEERKHQEEIQFLKRTNQQLKNQLESILAPAKK